MAAFRPFRRPRGDPRVSFPGAASPLSARRTVELGVRDRTRFSGREQRPPPQSRLRSSFARLAAPAPASPAGRAIGGEDAKAEVGVARPEDVAPLGASGKQDGCAQGGDCADGQDNCFHGSPISEA